MATILREQIYSAVRAFTCATVAEAEAATKVIIRLVDNALPDDVEARSAVERELDRLGYNDSNTNVVLKLAEFLKSVKL